MARNRISFAESAVRDLEEITVWYTEQDVPEIGKRLVTEIIQRIESLADHGELGRIVPEFEQINLRELIHSPFRIVYRYDMESETRRIRVVRVWRGERMLQLPEGGEEV